MSLTLPEIYTPGKATPTVSSVFDAPKANKSVYTPQSGGMSVAPNLNGGMSTYGANNFMPAVLTSSAADKHINETVKPALNDMTTGIQTQQQTLAAKKAQDDLLAQQNSATQLTDQEKQAKIDEIRKKTQLIDQELNPTDPTDSAGSFSEQDPLEDTNNALAQAQADYQAQAKQVHDVILNIQNGSIPLNAGEQAQIAGLQQQFGSLIEQQKLINAGASGIANVRGYQSGAAEYDPNFQIKTIGSIVTAGNNKVADLNIKMASAVADLTQSFKNNDIAAVKDAWGVFQDASKKRTDALQKTVDDTQAAIKAAQDAYQKEQDKVTEIAKDAAKNGASPDQLASILNSGSAGEAIYNAGDSLQTGTGTVGEYLYYKRDAAAHGQVPLSYNEYADMDANRKRSIVNIGSAAGGNLNSKQTTVFNSLVDKYNKSPLVAANDRAVTLKATRDALKADPTNASLQVAFIYATIQALDTYQSAVREGEIGLVSGTQGLGDKLANLPNKIAGGSVLSKGAVDKYIGTADLLVNSIQKGAERKQKTFASQAAINGPEVGQAFNEYVQGVNESGTTGGGIIQDENTAHNTVIDFVVSNPSHEATVNSLAGVVQPDLGRAYTWAEIAQIIGA